MGSGNEIASRQAMVKARAGVDAINYATKYTAKIKKKRNTTVTKSSLMNLYLRTFARKFSNIDFFLRILPLKDDELVMSGM